MLLADSVNRGCPQFCSVLYPYLFRINARSFYNWGGLSVLRRNGLNYSIMHLVPTKGIEFVTFRWWGGNNSDELCSSELNFVNFAVGLTCKILVWPFYVWVWRLKHLDSMLLFAVCFREFPWEWHGRIAVWRTCCAMLLNFNGDNEPTKTVLKKNKLTNY